MARDDHARYSLSELHLERALLELLRSHHARLESGVDTDALVVSGTKDIIRAVCGVGKNEASWREDAIANSELGALYDLGRVADAVTADCGVLVLRGGATVAGRVDIRRR